MYLGAKGSGFTQTATLNNVEVFAGVEEGENVLIC
jgi:hypothetical protein